MISKKIQEALNKQINNEFYSSYLYLSMAAYFESKNLGGFANWMRIQTQEEWDHGMKLYDYLVSRGGIVTLDKIKAPPSKWSSPLNVFEDTYKHEQGVTALINNLVNLALSEKDHATNTLLQWFVTEQVEEEASAETIIQKIRLAGDNSSALLFLDQELGARVAAPASNQ